MLICFSPHCGRKFNEMAAERHIPKCQSVVNKPKPPPKEVSLTPSQQEFRNRSQGIRKSVPLNSQQSPNRPATANTTIPKLKMKLSNSLEDDKLIKNAKRQSMLAKLNNRQQQLAATAQSKLPLYCGLCGYVRNF